ncbi:unnamed protein product, partial [Rotaria sordida]
MGTGEINYGDLMFGEENTAYYKEMSFIIIIVLVCVFTILITNVLIALAVDDIGELLKRATDTRIDKVYELGAYFEMLNYQ